MRVYLAHPIGTYGSRRERLAIELIEREGHQVINPRERQYADACGRGMDNWVKLAAACDAVALLPYRDGLMGCGMHLEMKAAHAAGRPIYQIDALAERWWLCETPPPDGQFLDMATTSSRNHSGKVNRRKARVPMLGHNTQVHPDLLAQLPAPSPPRSEKRPRRGR